MAKKSTIAAQQRREEVVARHAARRAELKEAQPGITRSSW